MNYLLSIEIKLNKEIGNREKNIQNLMKFSKSNIQIYYDVNNMAELMVNADIEFGGNWFSSFNYYMDFRKFQLLQLPLLLSFQQNPVHRKSRFHFIRF